MNGVVRFRAPWSGLLIAVSVLATLLLVAASLVCLAALPPRPALLRVTTAALPLAVVLSCLCFTVRGYAVTDRELIIERLGWSNRWPLTALSSAEFDPQAMKGSLRLWGNGGLFAFCGWFRNKKLGIYRVFATDLKRTVVLRFGLRNIVVTPDDPRAFLDAVNRGRTA